MQKPGDYVRDILGRDAGGAVTVRGWVRTRRDGKGVHFVQVNDGSSFKDLQVVFDAGSVDDAELGRVTTGACVEIDGEVTASPAAGEKVELHAKALRVIGAADVA